MLAWTLKQNEWPQGSRIQIFLKPDAVAYTGLVYWSPISKKRLNVPIEKKRSINQGG